eukprot:TCALIF_04508-PA protein Name:"Protein of unknown function" AED:0.17 eAED:0.17 QI:0/0/0/0.66/1/1/3/0/219
MKYVTILGQFDLDIVSQLDPRDFTDFGVMNTRKYADKLFRIFEAGNLNPTERTMVVVLATAVKTNKRIINAMKKFQGADWYRPVLDFFRNSCVQYTCEEEDDTFSVVHIPSYITEKPTVEGFFSNLWAAQIHLDNNLLSSQKVWQTNFWDSVVKKGGNNFEKGKFNNDYWETKSTDKYLLLEADGTPLGSDSHVAGATPYNMSVVKKWIATKVIPDIQI